jgi:hypothetical protein
MPPVIAAVAAIGAAIAASVSVGSVVTAIIGTAISIGLNIGASLLSKKQAKTGNTQDAGSRLTISQSAVDSHKIVYGRVRVSGTLVVSNSLDFAGVRNYLLFFYIVLAAHEIDGFEELWINSELATVAENGNITNLFLMSNGTYTIHIWQHKGLDNQSVDLTLTSPPMTSDFRMRGLAAIKLQLTWNRNAYPGGVPQFSQTVRGRKLYDPRATTINVVGESASGVVTTQTDHGLSTNDSLWVASSTDGKSREVRINAVLGDKQLTLRDPYSGSESTIKLKLGSGDKLSKMVWSQNWALVVRDYLSNPQWGMGSRQSEIDDASVIAAANISDETITLADGSTEKRYTANGIVDTADNPFDILEALRTAGGPGIITWTQGKWKIIAASYSSPVATITTDWLAGDVQVQARHPRQELFNAVKGVYVAPDKDWQPTDFSPITNAFYQAQDFGERIYKDVQFSFTTSNPAAQRLAKIILERGRQQIIVTLQCNLRALQVGIGDNVYLTLSDFGWTNKVFSIQRWEMNQEDGIKLTLQEESAAAYAWNNGEETTVDDAPDTNLPNPREMIQPGNPTVTENLYATNDGSGLKSKASLSWGESASFNIDRYVVDYRLVSSGEYTPAGETIFTTLDVFDLSPGIYEFRIRAVSLVGVISQPSSTIKEFFGLSAPPADISNFAMAAINNQAHLSWNQAIDLDVKIGGYIRLRWASQISALWSDGIDLGEALPGTATTAVVPLLAGTYMLKAVDSSGTESDNPAFIETNIVNIQQMTSVATISDSPTWPGTKTNTIVAMDGSLQLDGAAGAIELSGDYIFAAPLDLGAVYTARVYITQSSEVFDTTSLFDDADGLFDDRDGLFDGADISAVRLEFFIKTTNDDPTGTVPADSIWSEWKKFVVGDFNARAYWLKAVITNYKASYNIAIDELGLNIELPSREESFDDASISSTGTLITYNKPFYTRPAIGHSIQSAVSGDTINLAHSTSGGKYVGVTVQILNSGTGVDRIVDVIVRGY